MQARIFALITLAACGGAEPVELPESTIETTTTPATDFWPPPGRSQCANKASIVQIAVTVPEEHAGQGDIVVALMHRRYGSPENGGHPHWAWTFEDQALSSTEPAFLKIDMCEGNAIMWSEENCEYNLIVLVDSDGDNGLTGERLARPDPGEPAILLPYEQSCSHEGPYRFEVSLDCLEGDACVIYDEEPACVCAEASCDSQSAICEL